jgi:methylmalonyl-CoA/ethylmalonyl-CoA epimerase
MNDLTNATLGQLALNAHDVDRATRFYRETLGMPFLFEYPGLAFFKCGEVRLMISRPEKPEFDHPGSILYYKVKDLEATYATLKARGVTFRDPPHLIHRAPSYELWMAFFTDSEGNFAGLMTEKPIDQPSEGAGAGAGAGT